MFLNVRSKCFQVPVPVVWKSFIVIVIIFAVFANFVSILFLTTAISGEELGVRRPSSSHLRVLLKIRAKSTQPPDAPRQDRFRTPNPKPGGIYTAHVPTRTLLFIVYLLCKHANLSVCKTT